MKAPNLEYSLTNIFMFIYKANFDIDTPNIYKLSEDAHDQYCEYYTQFQNVVSRGFRLNTFIW